MPIYCALCYDTFLDEDSRDKHILNGSCNQIRGEKPEGITAQQAALLIRRAPSNLTPEAQWYGVFDILFPGHDPRPATPYVSSNMLQDELRYKDFLLQQGS